MSDTEKPRFRVAENVKFVLFGEDEKSKSDHDEDEDYTKNIDIAINEKTETPNTFNIECDVPEIEEDDIDIDTFVKNMQNCIWKVEPSMPVADGAPEGIYWTNVFEIGKDGKLIAEAEWF